MAIYSILIESFFVILLFLSGVDSIISSQFIGASSLPQRKYGFERTNEVSCKAPNLNKHESLACLAYGEFCCLNYYNRFIAGFAQ